MEGRPVTRRELIRTMTGAVVSAGIAANASSVFPEERSTHLAMSEPKPDMAVQADAGQQPWYRRLLVGIEIGPTGANDKDNIYMAKATGKAFVEQLLRAKAEYGVIFMKDMEFAYYNSKAARKCPNLGDRDMLRECLDEAKKHGLPLVAYCQIQYDDSSWRAHPEWRMKDASGADIGGRLCYNSGYIEFIKRVATEMMQYEISGFHFDMLDYGFGLPVGCWCECCRSAFQKEYGAPMPVGVTWDEAWERMLEFRCNSNTRFCHQLQAFVKAARPDISVDFNYHGYPPFSWLPGEQPVQHAMNGDFVTAEGLPWIFGHNNPSLLALFMAGARPAGPVQGVTSRGVFDYHDFTVRPVAEMKWEVMTYLAHGAQCTIVDKLYYDGATEPLAYERMGRVFEEARRKREYFGHEPVAEVGLYYSCRSRDWYGREDPPRYMAAFWGAHRALMQAHIPISSVMDENVTPERLRRFPVLYLPGAVILTDREVSLLDEYVSGGGNLLVTGLTGAFDRYGRPQDRSALEELIGARLKGLQTQYPDNFLRLPGDLARGEGRFLLEDVPPDCPLMVWGPIAVYEPAGAQAYGEILVAHRSRDNMWSAHMSPDKAVGPAVLVNRRGKGTILCVPCVLDAAYAGDYRMPEHRNLLRNLIRFLNPHPKVLIQAPANVEAVVTQDAERKRLLVHLLCFHAPPTFSSAAFPNGKRVLPPIMEEPDAYEAKITANVPFVKASAAGPGAKVVRRGNEVRLATSSIHEVLVIQQ
jgi:hypothetical protein